MKKCTVLLVAIFALCIAAFAQEAVKATIENRPISELFDIIEQQTRYRIYCSPQAIDSLYVTVKESNIDPIILLEKVLSKTPLKASAFQNAIFILKEQLITSLPDGYHFKESSGEPDVKYDYLSTLDLTEAQKRQLIAESKIYEVGYKYNKSSGTVVLSGTITNVKTGKPMVGLSLFPDNSTAIATTDSAGYYSVKLPVGQQKLNLRGHNITDTKIQLMVYSSGTLNFGVEEFMFVLDEATVSSERLNNVRSTTIGRDRIKLQEVKNIPSVLGEVDVIKVVMSLPGVKSVGEASSGFNVRGGATDQNLILFNDGTIYNPTHLFGIFSTFNPDMVDGMELYKSSIPAKYGGRISSVLDIKSKVGNNQEFKGSASIGLLTSRLTLEGPLFSPKTSFIVGGRATYSDWMLKLLPEKSGYKDGSAGFYDLNAVINHKLNKKNSVAVAGYYSHDRFSFDSIQRYSYTNANAAIKWKHSFSDKFWGDFTAGYDHYGYETREREQPFNAYTLTFSVDQVFIKADFTKQLNEAHRLSFGVNGIYYSLNQGEYKPYGIESIVNPDKLQKEKAIETALYIDEQWDATSALSLNVGIRYSLFGVLGPRTYNTYDSGYLPSLSGITEVNARNGLFKTYHNPEFRLSGRYAFSSSFSVKAGVNTMQQYIHKISNTTIMSPTDTWKLSDVNIKPQKGLQVAAGLYKNLMLKSGLVELSGEAYYKTMTNYLDYRSGAVLVMNPHLETDVIAAKGRAYGVELMAKKQQGKLNGWISYTYSRVQLQQDDSREAEPINNGSWYPASFDKPHELKLMGNYKFTHRFSISVSCDYSTGRPVTLPLSKYIYQGGELVIYSDRNTYRIPDYFRIDASINIEPSHHLTLLTHSYVAIGVYNVTGRKNPYSVYYASENGVLKGYRLSIFGAPIPYISYNIKF